MATACVAGRGLFVHECIHLPILDELPKNRGPILLAAASWLNMFMLQIDRHVGALGADETVLHKLSPRLQLRFAPAAALSGTGPK